jgi:hypothetical protein
MLRVRNAMAGSALRSWRLFAIAESQRISKRIRLLSGLFVNVLHFVKLSAFSKWRWCVYKCLDCELLLNHTLKLVCSNSLRLINAYFRQWDIVVQREKAISVHVPKLVSKVAAGLMRQATGHWRHFIAAAIEVETSTRSVKSAFSVTKRFLLKMQRASMNRAWQCWLLNHRDTIRCHQKLQFVKKRARRVCNIKCVRAWNQWHGFVVAERLVRDRVCVMLRRYHVRELRNIMMKWRKHISLKQEEEAELEKRKTMMRRVLLRLGRSQRISALVLWVRFVANQKSIEAVTVNKAKLIKTKVC